MVATNSVLDRLASVILCSALASAVPADPMVRPHIAYRRATPSTDLPSSTGSPTVSTYSTTTSTLGFHNPLSNTTATTSTSVLAPYIPNLAPKSGCEILTKRVEWVTKSGEYNEQYCTCAGTPPSSVHTIMGYSSRTLSTYCNTGAGSLPTNYVEVPDVSGEGPWKYGWDGPAIPSANCANAEVLNPGCWDALALTAYVTWWWDNFQYVCDGKGFAECFFRAMTPYTAADCSHINIGSPCSAPKWIDFMDVWNGVENFYVAYTIYAVNNFFSNYQAAFGFAGSTADSMLGSMIAIVNPIKKPNTTLNIILTAFSFALALIPGPGEEAGTAVATFGKTLLSAAQQAPAVAKSLFPASPGTVESQVLEWQQISASLGTAVTNLTNGISAALSAIETDVANFLPFAKSGTFIQRLPDQNDLQNQISSALNAYLISLAYHANGIFIARQTNTSVYELATNGTSLNFDTLCKDGYGANSICDSFWYDADEETTYSLVSGDRFHQKNYNSDMQTWFSNSKYTTPAMFFKAADLCAHPSKPHEGSGAVPSIPEVSTSCFSNIKVCTWNLDPQVDTSIKQIGPHPFPAWFSDCTNEDVLPGSVDSQDMRSCNTQALSDFTDGGHPYYGGNGFFVPRTYLGWEILNNDVFAAAKKTYGACGPDVSQIGSSPRA